MCQNKSAITEFLEFKSSSVVVSFFYSFVNSTFKARQSPSLTHIADIFFIHLKTKNEY